MLIFSNKANFARGLMKFQRIENEIRYLMRLEKIPGISMVMIENAEVIEHYEYGLKNSKKSKLF